MTFTRTELRLLETIISTTLANQPPTTASLTRMLDGIDPVPALEALQNRGYIMAAHNRWLPLMGHDGEPVQIPLTVRNELMRGPATLPRMPALVRVRGRLKLARSVIEPL